MGSSGKKAHNYIPLHLHTQYSLLDGLNTPAEYVERAKQLGITHLSQTDHGTIAGHREFQRACSDGGITPILGLEAYISPTDRFDKRGSAKRTDGTSVYNHITLLAKDQNGLENLSRLSEIGWTEGYYHKPRIDTESLEQYSGGLIVLSGCLNGMICKQLESGNEDKAIEIAMNFKEIFGERFFIEVQSHNPSEVNHMLLKLADDLNIPPVMASDCHYAKPEDLWAEEAMLILSTNPKQAKDIDRDKMKKMDMLEKFNYLYPDRKMTFQDIELYLRSYEDESTAFQKQGITRTDIYENTLLIGDMVSDYSFHAGLDLLPKPKVDPNERLLSLCKSGMKRRGCDSEEYRKRLEVELEIVRKKNFSTYFLIVSDMVNWAKKQGIFMGPGRGSAAGSLINYLIGITEIDPVKHNLLFARFINEERNDNPDVDVDTADSRRHEVKDYLTRKFKNVASISTFNYFKDKGVVRDASRVVGVPLGDVNKVLKTIDSYEEFSQGANSAWFRNKYPEVLKIANYLRGRIRGVGMHAAGMVVSNEPINKYAPIETRTDKDNSVSGRIPVIGYDMNEAESVGFIKIDVLGLKTLSVISDCLAEIDEDIDLNNIDMDDPEIYRNLSNGFTKGVFQAEAAPYTNLLVKMGVDNFDQLVASNALVRPGAMNTVGGDYIARKQGRQSPVKIHEIYDEITSETYGLPIYQEQVMLLCNKLAGMSWSDADKIRKIIGKKKDVSEFEEYRSRFIEGATKHINSSIAEKLWHDFEAHSNYSFNKSHAVAYSTLTYWTAWLKHYYPKEFMCALLKNESDKDALTDYLIECKRLRIPVYLPHVNSSGLNFQLHDDGIIFGLSNIKFISDNIGSKILAKAPFASYKDLLSQTVEEKGSGINSRAVDALNKIGAARFDDNETRGDEDQYYYEYLNIPNFNAEGISEQVLENISNIVDFEEIGSYVFYAMVKSIKKGSGWSRVEIVDRTGSVGVFHNEATQIEPGSMYLILVSDNRIMRYINVDELDQVETDPFVRWLNSDKINIQHDQKVVVAFSSRKTKAGKYMASVTLSNQDKKLFSAVVFPGQFAPALARLKPGRVVKVDLRQIDNGLMVKEIK